MTEYLTTAETSEITSVPEATLRWYRHQQIGPVSFRLGGRVRYRREDVEKWVAEQYAATASVAGAVDG